MDKLERGEKNERYDKSYNTYNFIFSCICWIYYLWVIQKPSNRKWKIRISISIRRRFMILRQKEKRTQRPSKSSLCQNDALILLQNLIFVKLRCRNE